MVKHRRHKESGCTGSARVTGNHVRVHATLPLKGGAKAPCTKPKDSKVVRHRRHTEVPAACKGLKKISRRLCVKRVCAQRPGEYREQCLKKAGLRV